MSSAGRWLTCRLAAVVLGTACVVLAPGPASADDGSLLVDVPGDAVGFTHDPAAPLLDVHGLHPGSSGDGTMDLRNTSAHDADLELTVSGIVSVENDCVRPETREAGEDCDADGGELDDWLDVTVTRMGDGDHVLWSGHLQQLAGGVDLGQLAAGATTGIRFAVTLPQAAPNDTMTDSVSFDTRITATSTAGGSTVAGPQVVAAAGVTPPAGPQVALPLVGGTVSLWWLLVDAAALLLGAALVVRGRLSRRSRSR